MVDESDDYNNTSDKIILLASEIIRLINQKYLLAEQECRDVIDNGIRDEIRIESNLDSLLECIVYKKGEDEFQELNNYYRNISPAGADFYEEELAKELRDQLQPYIENHRIFSEDAIPNDQKPGAKAGNPLVDRVREQQSREYFKGKTKLWGGDIGVD